jgi:hypothetical protein
MTGAEALELAEMAGATSITSFGYYLSIIFAYLAAAYFVGDKLSKSQVIVASGLFVFAGFCAIAAVTIFLGRVTVYLRLAKKTEDINGAPFYVFESSYFWSSYLGILCALGLVMALKFMWDVRHPKAE